MTATLDLVRQADDLITSIRDAGIEPVAVCLDTLNRSLMGSENNDQDMGAYIAACDRIREALDPHCPGLCWRWLASTMPSGWFGRESYPLLASYCRHVCRSRWLASKIDTDADRLLKIEGGVALLDKLFAMAEREGRAQCWLMPAHSGSRSNHATTRERQGVRR